MPLHLPKFIAEKAKLLDEASIDCARAEIELILCHVTGFDRLHLYMHGAEFLSEDKIKEVDKIIEKRITRYPIQYILEECWFYGRCFTVSPAVMVPTPETESLVERGLGFINSSKLTKPNVLDIGTGSGVIAVTIAAELPDVSLLALDISSDALTVAEQNAVKLGADTNIEFRQSDLFTGVNKDERFNLILSNPPYIAEPDYPALMPEVHADPRISLTSGDEGLDIIKQIIQKAPEYLEPKGRIMFEIGYDQSAKVAAITQADSRYKRIDIIKDLNDIDRIVILGCD